MEKKRKKKESSCRCFSFSAVLPAKNANANALLVAVHYRRGEKVATGVDPAPRESPRGAERSLRETVRVTRLRVISHRSR